MYIDIIVLLVILLFVIFYFRRFSSFVYTYVVIDILLRLIRFISLKTREIKPELSYLLYKDFSPNIISLFTKYLGSSFIVIFEWITFFIYVSLIFYLIRNLIRRGK